ncbi:SusC/RagA family TonB-linked outer membrane protein [Bacteroidia bacterium]|nr:SusC/RagA family TonB-linked outer membrane protein [Bacteroidia bacterium]
MVSDVDGTIIGASVVEKGNSGNGVATDVDGRYSLQVPPNATLEISYLGYATQSVAVNGKTTVNITLQSGDNSLDEVVVVAYGTQKKSSITGSIAVIKDTDLKTVTSPSVQSMLQGKVAGVQVLNTSGKPGETAQIRIRGKSTLDSSSDPLWVVDGVVAQVGAPLNPNEIASISVLKDAAATALYGSRATNGVILVTTKSGRAGESSLNVSAKTGIATQYLGNFELMNAKELYDYTSSMGGQQPSWVNEALLNHDTNWFDIATQSALSQNYTVSYTTGREKMRSFLMADYYSEEGTMKGFDYSRYSLRSNNDYTVNDRLTIKTKFSGSFYRNFSQEHSVRSAMLNLPWDYPYNENGAIRTGKESDWHGRDSENYLYNLPYGWTRGKAIGVSANVGFDYKITDWLIFESNNNIGYRYTLDEEYTDPQAIGANEYNGSIVSKNNFYTTRYTNQLLRFIETFDDIHNVSAFLGYEFSDSRAESNSAEGRGIPSGSEVLNVAANPYKVDGNIVEYAMQSVYFNANYTYNNRYMAQFSFRTDGSSRFGKNNRYSNFFTVGLGWAIHEEDFMKDISWVNQLKLRGSYGSIGNVPNSNYGYLSVYSISTQYNGVPSAFPSRLGNPNLTWEKCYETNIAVDARLFDRVGLSVEWYNKNTSDLLYNVNLSTVTGYATQWRNVGAVRNRGVEIVVSPDLVRSKDFLWTADFNIGFNKGVIDGLYEGRSQIIGSDMGSQKIREENVDIDTWYLREWAGVDVYSGDPMWYIYNYDENNNVTGRTLTTNQAAATRVKMGTSNPDFSGGLTTSASYKGFTLSAGMTFVYGNKIYNGARQFYDNDGAYPEFNSMKLKDGWVRWEKPGDIATHPKAIWGGNNMSEKPSSRYLEDGSFLKLGSMSLSYSLPTKWLSQAGVKSLDITLSGEKLITFTKFSGFDPEITTGNNGSVGEGMQYPAPRRVSLGLNLTF